MNYNYSSSLKVITLYFLIMCSNYVYVNSDQLNQYANYAYDQNLSFHSLQISTNSLCYHNHYMVPFSNLCSRNVLPQNQKELNAFVNKMP